MSDTKKHTVVILHRYPDGEVRSEIVFELDSPFEAAELLERLTDEAKYIMGEEKDMVD